MLQITHHHFTIFVEESWGNENYTFPAPFPLRPF